MLSLFIAIAARCAILVAFAIILGSVLPRMPQNRVGRFAVWSLLWVSLNVVNYVNVWTLGYHKTGGTETFIFAFLLALWTTIWPPRAHNSNTP